MPELPEVETTLRGIYPHLIQNTITAINIRQARLRWPVSDNLENLLTGKTLLNIERRAKYLLFQFNNGYLLIHLGMSGSLQIVSPDIPAAKHAHVDIHFDKKILRYTDPRRFGAILWLGEKAYSHSLLAKLGVEPLEEDFNGQYLYQLSRGKKQAVKQFIMDQQVVTGVGNIYANESLFSSGISPVRAAGNISLARYQKLAKTIRTILEQAIRQGGTTLKDFTGGDGKPGYFKQELQVYGRKNQPCPDCKKPLQEIRLNNRSTVYCTACQS